MYNISSITSDETLTLTNASEVTKNDIATLILKAKLGLMLTQTVDQGVSAVDPKTDTATVTTTTTADPVDEATPSFNSVTDILNWIRELFASLSDFNIKKIDVFSILQTLKSIEDIVDHPEKYPNLHLSQSDIDSIKKLLSSNNIKDSTGMSIGKFLATLVIALAYEKGNQNGAKQEIANLIALFGADNSSIGMINDITQTLALYSKDFQALMTDFRKLGLIDKDNKLLTNFEDHLYGAFDAFMVNSNYQKNIKKIALDSLMQYFTDHFSYVGADGKHHWKNPDLVFILMMQAVMNPNIDLLESSIAGMSDSDDVISSVAKTISDLMSKMKTDWGKSSDKDYAQECTDAMNWMKELMDNGLDKMSAYEQSLFKGGVFANFKTALSVIIDNKGVKDAMASGNSGDLVTALNQIHTDNPNAFRDALSGAQGVLTNQSSVLKGLMDQYTADIKTESGSIETILKAMSDFDGFIAQAMGRSS